MYYFKFFRNQLWRYLISYNSFRNVNLCLLEVAMCEKCRSSYLQSEGVVKSLRTGGGEGGGRLKTLGLGGAYFCWEVSTPLHAMFLEYGKFLLQTIEGCKHVRIYEIWI